jgi:hypothetical protein
MTADELRAKGKAVRKDLEIPSRDLIWIESLIEIAAQLAEIKELLNGKAVERIVSALEGIERR